MISHHGKGRPLLPPVADGTPEPVAAEVAGAAVRAPADLGIVDWQQPARFRRLSDHFGPWGAGLARSDRDPLGPCGLRRRRRGGRIGPSTEVPPVVVCSTRRRVPLSAGPDCSGPTGQQAWCRLTASRVALAELQVGGGDGLEIGDNAVRAGCLGARPRRPPLEEDRERISAVDLEGFHRARSHRVLGHHHRCWSILCRAYLPADVRGRGTLPLSSWTRRPPQSGNETSPSHPGDRPEARKRVRPGRPPTASPAEPSVDTTPGLVGTIMEIARIE